MLKNKKIFISYILIFACIITLVSFSYAWIERNWQPKITETNIKIQTGSSLAIILDDKSPSSVEEISLNDVLGANSDIALKQVSNYSGESEDFFTLDYTENIKNPKIVKITKPESESNWKQTAINNGYFEFRFLLYGRAEDANFVQYIFLSDKSKLDYPVEARNAIKNLEAEKQALNPSDPDYAAKLESINYNINNIKTTYDSLLSAIRISITIEGIGNSGSTNITHGIKMTTDEHSAITNIKEDDGSYFADNEYLYIADTINNEKPEVDPRFIFSNNRTFHTLDYYTSAFDGTTVNTDKVLFTMASSERRWITFRIWLEGQDPHCTDEIAGLEFDLNIVFESKSSDTM